MALHNLIARSGAENFETMRRGWLPTTEERQKEEMRGLQIQSTKSELDYTPTRRKMAEESANLDNDYKQSLMQKHKDDSARFKSEADAKKYALNQKNLGRHLTTASKQKTVEQKKRYLQDYKSEFLEAGNDKEDKAFNSVMELKGSEFDRSFDMMLQGNKFIQGLNEKRFGQFTSLQNYSSNKTETVSLNDPDYESKINDLTEGQGFTVIKTPGLEMSGTAQDLNLGGSKADTLEAKNIEGEQATRNGVLGYQSVMQFVMSDNFMGGNLGDAVSNVNSFVAQTRQIFGLDSVLDSSGVPDESAFDPESKLMNRFRRGAINQDRFSSAIIELAYVKAKTLDPGGRISDADLRYAQRMINAGADKASLINLLRDNQRRALSKYNSDVGVLNRRLRKGKSQFPTLKLEDIIGSDTRGGTQNSKSIAQDILKEMDF